LTYPDHFTYTDTTHNQMTEGVGIIEEGLYGICILFGPNPGLLLS